MGTCFELLKRPELKEFGVLSDEFSGIEQAPHGGSFSAGLLELSLGAELCLNDFGVGSLGVADEGQITHGCPSKRHTYRFCFTLKRSHHALSNSFAVLHQFVQGPP